MGRDLTTGSIFGNVVRFSLPYLLSYFLQTLYGMADLFIIGQYAGVKATTAVSSSASAATSAPAGAPGCRSCTTFCPLSASASPAHIPPRGCFRRRICRRAISRSTTACFLRLTRRMCLKAT